MLRVAELEEEAHREELERIQQTTVKEFWSDFFGADNRRGDLALAANRRATGIANRERMLRDSQQDQADLRALIKELSQAKNARPRAASFRVWQSLWQADSESAVSRTCDEWLRLPRRYRDELVAHEVKSHGALFVSMKNDSRFPRSPWADEARIIYLARGTAGLIMGISPLTAIERLRKVSHRKDHPLFKDERCSCWRCALQRRRERIMLPEIVPPQRKPERKRGNVRREGRKR